MNRPPAATFELPTVEALNADFSDDYDVTELIGAGGMGAVYRAVQPGLERTVAIKILPPSLTGPKEQFEKEAQAMARCGHPNIVAVYEVGETASGIPFIAMEYVDGPDLQACLDEQNVSLQKAFAWIRQLCDALSYAHARGLVHLDIKPANLLIGEDGRLKVADFGLAKLVQANETGQGVGTPIFVAPEVTCGDAVDQRADIYSLGVILYQILTGNLPRGIWRAPSDIKPELDPRFDRVIELAMKKNPGARYQQVVEVEADLTEILFSRPDGTSSACKLEPAQLRNRLIGAFLGMLGSQVIGSWFNIRYNQKHIIEMFFKDAPERFTHAAAIYNLCIYLPLVTAWGFLVFSLLKLPCESLAAKRRVINLPWWALGIAAIGWFGTIPGIGLPLRDAGNGFIFELTVSVIIGATMALTQGYLTVDLICQKLLYRHFFSANESPWRTEGAFPPFPRRSWYLLDGRSGRLPSDCPPPSCRR